MPSRMEEQMKLRGARVSYLRQTSLPNKRSALLQIRSDLRQVVAVVVAVVLMLAPVAWAERTQLKPGWNLFSPEQDAQLGRQVSRDAERQVPMLNDARVDAYLNSLGRRLAANAPYHYFQYQFKCVNDRAINAFALPGGFVYINRGVLEAADNEAQVAGVMAHEISHVELRHGTNQATKAYAWQVPLGVLGGALGNNAVGAVAQAIGGFAVNSVLLKYSRTAESQADILGTQILYDSGYDPRAMAQFFEKLEAESKGKNPPEFFSDHPNPEHRVERVDEEVEKLGGVQPNFKRDSAEFEAIKREVLALPVVKKPTPGAAGAVAAPAPPSRNFAEYQGNSYTLKYPDNWKKYPDSNGGVSFAPEGGVLDDGSGHSALAYGLVIGVAQAKGDPNDGSALNNATSQVIQDLQKSSPSMKITRQGEHLRLNGQPGLSTYLSNLSPAGGQETDWVITVLRPEGLIYFVCVAPQSTYDNYDKTFSSILDSVRFTK